MEDDSAVVAFTSAQDAVVELVLLGHLDGCHVRQSRIVVQFG